MPTHASNAQNAQNRMCSSCLHAILIAKDNALTAHTSELSFACKTRGSSDTLDAGRGFAKETMVVYRREPSIMAIMKQEKMYPRGSGLEDVVVSCRDGTQRKTNKYMDPSKHV